MSAAAPTAPPLASPPIPHPRLAAVRNLTPFPHLDCDKMGAGRKFFDTIVVKGTFALSEGLLTLAEEQQDIVLADDYWDPEAAERSSLRHAGEALLIKPTTDVIVTGTARPPGKDPLPAWDASVSVRRGGETVIEHRARVLGPRVFRHGAGGWAPSDPEPTLEVPIRYELAYGGAYLAPPAPGAPPSWVVHEPNPSGTGFFDEAAMDPGVTYRAPQWEPPAHPVAGINREVPLAGFGPVARPWSSRVKYAGTYDEAWEREMRADSDRGLPADYAKDFDTRFFQAAHPELVAPAYLEGDEEVVLAGVVPGAAPLVMRLPGATVSARLLIGRGEQREERMVLDTVHVDVDAGAVYLCWRITLDQARDVRGALITARRQDG